MKKITSMQGGYSPIAVALCSALVFLGLFSPQDAYARAERSERDKPTAVQSRQRHQAIPRVKVYRPSYWHLGVELMSPLTFGTLYSWTNQGNVYPGLGAQISGGYQFSSVFGLQMGLGLGRSRAEANGFQREFRLGTQDAYTYYPYTMIDGTVYRFPAATTEGNALIGEQGNNPATVQLSSTPFPLLKSEISFWQTSLSASFNLTRLFYAQAYVEKPLELWLRPGVYLSHYSARIVSKQTGERVAPSVNKDLTLGLGGDLALRFNLSPAWAIDLSNRLVWQHDRALDGVRSIRHAYDAFVWQPSLGLVYKFRRQEADLPEVAPQAERTPGAALTGELASTLAIALPRAVTLPEVKPRGYSASIALTYPLNKTYIDRNLHNNASELQLVDTKLKAIAENPDYRIRSIVVEGFASPEGPLQNNWRLSTGRAWSIIGYLKTMNPQLEDEKFQLGRVEENWAGLRDTLEKNPHLPSRDEALALLNRERDTERVKVEIQRLSGYKALLENVYPYLRKSTYTVSYDVRSYALPEAKARMKTHPSDVGPEEMFAVALNDGLTTQEGISALTLLEKTHPNAPITKLVRAYRQLEGGQNAEALRTLESLQMNDPYYYNLIGVAEARLGHWDAARKYFALSTTEEAQSNLRRIITAR